MRESYVSGLIPLVVDPLLDDGTNGVARAIEAMDEYFLVPEDRDTLVELEIGDARREERLKKLPSATKSAFQ